MTPRRQNDAAWFRSLAGMVLIGIAAHAGLPYLPVAGPPALRIAAKKIPPPAVVEIKPAKTPTNIPPVLATVPLPTNAPNAETKEPIVQLLTMPALPADETFNLAAQGQANITPQMLATYFRPVTTGTNGGFVTGQVPMGFVPPFTHPDSRAEYIVK